MNFLEMLRALAAGEEAVSGAGRTGAYFCPDCGRSINVRDRKAKRLHGRGKMANWNKPCGRKLG